MIRTGLRRVRIFPATIHHFAMEFARANSGASSDCRVPLRCAQPLVIRLSLWAGEVPCWPLPRRQSSNQVRCLETAAVILNIEIWSLPITAPNFPSGLI